MNYLKYYKPKMSNNPKDAKSIQLQLIKLISYCAKTSNGYKEYTSLDSLVTIKHVVCLSVIRKS